MIPLSSFPHALPSSYLDETLNELTTGVANTYPSLGRSLRDGLYSLRSRSRQVVSAFGNDPYRISPAETLQGHGTGRLPSIALQGAEGGFIADQEQVLGACRHGENMTGACINVATPHGQQDCQSG